MIFCFFGLLFTKIPLEKRERERENRKKERERKEKRERERIQTSFLLYSEILFLHFGFFEFVSLLVFHLLQLILCIYKLIKLNNRLNLKNELSLNFLFLFHNLIIKKIRIDFQF